MTLLVPFSTPQRWIYPKSQCCSVPAPRFKPQQPFREPAPRTTLLSCHRQQDAQPEPRRGRHPWARAPRLSPGARGCAGPPPRDAGGLPAAAPRERRVLLTDNLFRGRLLSLWWRCICPSVVEISSHWPWAVASALRGALQPWAPPWGSKLQDDTGLPLGWFGIENLNV